MSIILHITKQADWERARRDGVYRGDTLATEGFIHCSTPAQVLLPANALFRGQTGLVLLCIDPARLDAEIRHESAAPGGERFPHLYGPLNTDAVVEVFPFLAREDGTFLLPPGLSAA